MRWNCLASLVCIRRAFLGIWGVLPDAAELGWDRAGKDAFTLGAGRDEGNYWVWTCSGKWKVHFRTIQFILFGV